MEIKELRTRLGLTQQQFAERIGVTVGVVSRWERGISHPSKLVQRIIDGLEKRTG